MRTILTPFITALLMAYSAVSFAADKQPKQCTAYEFVFGLDGPVVITYQGVLHGKSCKELNQDTAVRNELTDPDAIAIANFAQARAYLAKHYSDPSLHLFQIRNLKCSLVDLTEGGFCYKGPVGPGIYHGDDCQKAEDLTIKDGECVRSN